ncbi:hypothetical protein JRG42_22395 [Pseudomonas granadensis]|uniref:hypothetical protein n=1 Tax=Pseudomonas granadensis TaxID=1421430 RepID=UPI0019CFADE2|nr:hypothetical protein [Pseudomonas granadensis]MBN6775947.1 hypothetical protein [Pseudomonas granadensis]MBN6807795.1 hypothetical protein [Pseudomonas granadensis]MBN6833921.1 hypothetical protein [Pseudomonas granadensis]MBN6841434.1 hypothetical protein [Pseudomonas granadensis]MBN6870109.1 hypothetical protein [Pseudomonas granadensis]
MPLRLISRRKVISRIKDTEAFIAKSKAKFGQQFHYVETLWHSASTPVVLHCLRHNPPEKVEINPDHHLRKKGGCRQCKADSARARHGKTREVFIAEAKARHGEAFDYGKLVYVNAKTEVLIYCLKHCIEFWQLPEVHLKGGGCPACKSAKLKKSNAELYDQRSVKYEEFLTRANLTHNGYYRYEPESYVGFGKNVRIICPKHGVFSQRAERHASGSKCKKCVADNLKITEPVLRSRIEQKFGSILSVRFGAWSGFKTIVQAFCCRHRHSWSLTASALLSGGGCRHCVNELKNQPALAALVSSLPPELHYLETSRNPDFLRFSIDATRKHRAQYRYEENLFISFSRPCQVICHTHGAFKLKPEEHLGGTGCHICAYQDQFIRSARQRFADRFDYGQTNFSHASGQEKVSILCVEHGVRGSISAALHLRGTSFCGVCKSNSRVLTTEQNRRANQNALLQNFREEAFAAHSGKYEYPNLEEELVTRVSKITAYCKQHDFTFTPSAAAHVQTGNRAPSGCQRCKGDISRLRYRKPYIEVQAKLAEHGFSLLTPEHDYKSQGESMLVRCNEGHEVNVVPQKIFSGRSCPNCSPFVGEAITRSILEEGFGFSLQKLRFKQKDHPHLIQPHASLELDGYNAQYKIAFEYQGAWHSQKARHRTEASYQRQLQRDEQKAVMCRELEITLIVINEFMYPFQAADVRKKIMEGIEKVGLRKQCVVPEHLLLLSHIPMLNLNGQKKLLALAEEHNLSVKETAWYGKWHTYSWQCKICDNDFKAPYIVREAAKWKCCPRCARNHPEVKERRRHTMKAKGSEYLEALRERARVIGLNLVDTEWKTAAQHVTYRFKCIHTKVEVKPRNYNSILLGYSGCDCDEHRRPRV